MNSPLTPETLPKTYKKQDFKSECIKKPAPMELNLSEEWESPKSEGYDPFDGLDTELLGYDPKSVFMPM